ncbi:glycosyltransferase [Vibrio metoecus]|uniref:glycosyltransferase n=1 Tax=Vibrio metoecus TaxID=1481663 RepID=UPI0006D7F8D0|nr:hypothetical protein [Vibrio metoecus]KQB03559.1 hypothetical protein XV93_16070 [Vibrio metoecus]PAR49010.1 glycosyltransferase [Vibrio metoecus]
MKILLVGEFSGLHKNLKEGLVELGHDVTIVSLRDGWKRIDSDISLDSDLQWPLAGLMRRFNVYTKMFQFKEYDIVQFINPFCLFYIPFLTKLLINRIIKNNKKTYLLAAGTDSFYLKYAREKMKYTPIDDYLKFDYKKSRHQYEKLNYFSFNKWFASKVNGIIPIMYEYSVCYSDMKNLKQCIPIPMNIDDIAFHENNFNGVLKVFHGLNRYGFKGTKYVEDAFNELNLKYRGKIDTVIAGKMPLDEYLKVLQNANVIIDQTSSYSIGVNAVYSLAMGKVVLGGAEPESLKVFNVNASPVINITPDKESIIQAVEGIINDKDALKKISKQSREYVELVHDYRKVALEYIKIWNSQD